MRRGSYGYSVPTNRYAYGDLYSDRCSDGNPDEHPDGKTDAYRDGNKYADGNGHQYTDGSCDGNADVNRNNSGDNAATGNVYAGNTNRDSDQHGRYSDKYVGRTDQHTKSSKRGDTGNWLARYRNWDC